MRPQFEPLDQFIHPLLAGGGIHAEITAHPVHDLNRRGERIDVEFLRAQADQAAGLAVILHGINAEDLDFAGGRLGDAGGAMNGRGFSRAIGAQKTEELAFSDLQRDIFHRHRAAAIDLAQMGNGKGGSHGRFRTMWAARMASAGPP